MRVLNAERKTTAGQSGHALNFHSQVVLPEGQKVLLFLFLNHSYKAEHEILVTCPLTFSLKDH